MAQAFITKSVVQAVHQTVEDKHKKIIDVSCGYGDILKDLHEIGYTNLHGTNHSDYPALPDEIELAPNTDLLKGLPFEDRSFDVVICSEVIEHVCNHVAAIKELSRILKPGGYLFLSTPNMMRIRSRLSFLLSGFHNRKHRFVRYNIPLDEYYRSHNFVIEFPLLHYFLHAAGMKVEKLYPSRMKAITLPFLILSYPLTFLFAGYELLLRDRDPSQKPFNLELFKFMMNPHLQGAEVMVLRARKVDGEGQTPKTLS